MIGLFDSGVGGLSILQAIQKLRPKESIVYLADTANFPYGSKTPDEILRLSRANVERLLPDDPRVIVVACNTASTHVLAHLRMEYPDRVFVGVVPVLKTAAATTKTGVVAVLATAATIASPAYADLKQRFGHGLTIIDQACPGWVEMIERGDVDGPNAAEAVKKIVEPLLDQRVDVLALGCTHYPFLRPVLERIVAARAAILDSGGAVARQVDRLLGPTGREEPPSIRFLGTGDAERWRAVAAKLLQHPIPVVQV